MIPPPAGTPVDGFVARVYRPVDVSDASMGGVSSKSSQLFITGDIVRAHGLSQSRRTLHWDPVAQALGASAGMLLGAAQVIPAVVVNEIMGNRVARPMGRTTRCMFGGNFLSSSDSRFRSLCRGPVLPVHDRIETEESALDEITRWAGLHGLTIEGLS